NVMPDMFERRFDEALRIWDGATVKTDEDRLAARVARATIRVIAGQREAARADCAQFVPQIDAALKQYPDSLSYLQVAAWTYVCLGRNAEALAAARHARDLIPIGKNADDGARYAEGLAEVAAQAGAPDEAFQLIEQLLSIPAGFVMTVERLKHGPV